MPSETTDPQGRKWLLTINNPVEKHLNHQKIKEILSLFPSLVYYCIADEKGETYHSHVFFSLEHPTRFSTVKRRCPEAHIDRVAGTAADCRAYVQKSGKWIDSDKVETTIPGTFEEWGELPEEPGQGYRSDIAEIYNDIVNGFSNAEIMRRNPDTARYISMMDKIRQSELEERFRDTRRELEVTYIFGDTGTGKTRGVLEEYGYRNVYRITQYKYPFDSYAQEPVICFDEFRSSIPIAEMLNYLDGYPLNLPAWYTNRTACYETVFIISNIDLIEQYQSVQQEEPKTWEAFLRRIHKVKHYTGIGEYTEYETAEYMKRRKTDI